MGRRKLPIGIQTFRKIREEGCYYVDKTPCIRRLADGGTHYFLSRARRFGKSLFLDTLKELFEGAEELFEGLDIPLLFDLRKFGAYWFETGTPSILIDVLSGRGVASPALDGMIGANDLLSAFDVDDIGTGALQFQTGYLTIREEGDSGGEPFYRLGYPNREVRQSLNRSLLRAMAPDPSRQLTQGVRLRELLAANDFEGLEELFRAFLSAIPPRPAPQERACPLRGLLRERVLLALRRGGAGRGGGGREQPRAGGHGGALQRPCSSAGVQGGRVGAGRGGDGAAQGPPLRGQVPRSRRADPPHRGGVQPRGPQPRRVRGGALVNDNWIFRKKQLTLTKSSPDPGQSRLTMVKMG